MSCDTPKAQPSPKTAAAMRQKWWVPLIVALAFVQAAWQYGKQRQQLSVDGEMATRTQALNTTTLDALYLPLNNVTSQPKTWQEPLFSQQPRLPLNFLHIPKTGGTSIVVAAANAGYAWSDCMFPLRRETKHCPKGTPVNKNSAYMPARWTLLHQYVQSWWHVPLQHLPKDDNHPNPYADQDLFVVIRNPYKRILSQYYYRCLRDPATKCFVNKKGKPIADSPKRMNEIVQQMVKKQQSATWGGYAYFYHDAHWVPQSHYVYDYSNGKTMSMRDRKRLVRHVLHFEYLSEDFASLMKAYHLDDVIQLSSTHKVNDRAEFETHTTVADLSVNTMRLIEQVYKDDFELGGYPMLSATRQSKKR